MQNMNIKNHIIYHIRILEWVIKFYLFIKIAIYKNRLYLLNYVFQVEISKILCAILNTVICIKK